jgi:peptidoglycan/xylan/chitin deacetylase (PgdA/CDA1 family)
MKTKIGIIFDDGFAKSSLATATLFEQYKLPAYFAVLAEPKGFSPNFRIGDFALWNELQARGHVVYPHGYTHVKMSEIPHEQAVGELERCLATFSEKLNGFDAKQAMYAFAYNCGTPALCEWLLPRVRAVRIGGTGFLSEADLKSRIWHNVTHGPDDPGDHLLDHLEQCRVKKPPAFFYSLHGLDGEAWGAIAQDKLKRVLDLITTDDAFEYWRIG